MLKTGLYFKDKRQYRVRTKSIRVSLQEIGENKVVGSKRSPSIQREQIPSVDWQESNIDSDDDLSLYLRAIQGLDVFTATEDTTDELTGNERMKDILKIAIGKEIDSIVYFLALKAFVPTGTRKRKIDNIIKDEM